METVNYSFGARFHTFTFTFNVKINRDLLKIFYYVFKTLKIIKKNFEVWNIVELKKELVSDKHGKCLQPTGCICVWKDNVKGTMNYRRR